MNDDYKQRAYEKLLTDGWTTNRAVKPTGECCAGGALAYGVIGNPNGMYNYVDETGGVEIARTAREFVEFAELRVKVDRHRRERGLDPVDEHWTDIDLIIEWNDHIATEEEVLETFKRFAEAE